MLYKVELITRGAVVLWGVKSKPEELMLGYDTAPWVEGGGRGEGNEGNEGEGNNLLYAMSAYQPYWTWAPQRKNQKANTSPRTQ